MLRLPATWTEFLQTEDGLTALQFLYKNEAEHQRTRYQSAVAQFAKLYGETPCTIVSAPGRTELCGNHTDHQRGSVLAAAVTLDTIAVVAPTNTNVIQLQSEGFARREEIDLRDLTPQPAETNHAASLIRGVAARFAELGHAIGGFDAYTTSQVPRGSGLSSSAAFEILVGTALNHLYNKGAVSPIAMAQVGQYVENVFFGKPCGLMDQMASSVGGIISIDFETLDQPIIDTLQTDFGAYDLCVTNAGGSHADLTTEYADIPNEMKQVAVFFGCDVLRQVSPETFHASLPTLRQAVSDRAILRAIHFFAEQERVTTQVTALRENRLADYMDTMLRSGYSSYMQLQNVYPVTSIMERSVSLALAVSESVLSGVGAWRVHGGGFAGTIQALVPHHMTSDYVAQMQALFGADSCSVLAVRPVGGYCLG